MNTKLKIAACFTVLLVSVSGNAFAQAKKRIAVMDFDDRQVSLRDAKVGTRVSDALVTKLSSMGSFELVDRQYIETLIKEQNLKFDDRFDPQGAAKIGKLANVSAVIVGHVSAFNGSVSTQNSGNIVQKKTKQVGHVELSATARLLNVQDGSIIAAISKSTPTKDEVLSESSQSNLINMGSSKNNGDVQSLLSKLIDRSVDELAGMLADELTKRAGVIADAAPPPPVAPKVMGIEDGMVFINRGSKDGIKQGAQYSVTRSVASSLVDPDTGKPVMRNVTVCTLAVSQVEASMASGKCMGDLPKAGDVANQQ